MGIMVRNDLDRQMHSRIHRLMGGWAPTMSVMDHDGMLTGLGELGGEFRVHRWRVFQ